MRWCYRLSLVAAVAVWATCLHGADPAGAVPIPPPPPPPPTAPSDAESGEGAEEEPLPDQPTATGVDSAAGSAPAETPTPASPYQAIIARNAFGLKTPPPAPPPPEPPQAQVTPSALKLTGVITLLGGRSAMFVLQEPGKPQLNSELVKEGESDSVITNLEVLQIDERAGAVRVVYGGKELTLDFVSNGLKPPAAPTAPPGGPGGAQARPGSVVTATPVAGVGRGIQVVGGSMQGAAGVPSAFQPGSAQPGAYQPAYQPGAYQPGVGGVNPNIPGAGLNVDNPSGLRSIPTRPTRAPFGNSSAVGVGAGNSPQDHSIGIPPEQQALLMRAQEEVSRRQGVPFPPVPPIPGLDGGSGAGFPPQPPQ